MSTTVATAPTAATEPTTITVPATTEQIPAPVPSSTVDDATYMMNTFSTLLEGDLYDDELNEISTLFAPAVSDDEKSASDSPVPPVDYENHPGAQVAVTAAAIDSALQTTKIPIAPKEEPTNNKRTYDQAIASAPAPPGHKRRVTLDGTTGTTKRITLSSSCGSLTALPAPTPAISAPVSPTSVVTPAPAVVPSSPVSSSTVNVADVNMAPKIPAVAPAATAAAPTKGAVPTATTTKAKKTTKSTTTKAPPTITIRQGMTPEEKAKACRERNREHARKTRLRKKAYVDELKRSLNEMVEQRDAAQALEEQKAKILEQNRDVRFQVMQDFLNLRGNNERNPSRWAAILVPEEFTLKLPITDFQTMVQPTEGSTTSVPGEQTLVGVSDVMADAGYFSSFLQTLGTTEANEAASPTYFVYHCNRDSFLMDGTQAMFNFNATSCGATAQGAPVELAMSGTFRASFCPDTNRLRSAQFMFDTGSVQFQLQHLKATAPATAASS